MDEKFEEIHEANRQEALAIFKGLPRLKHEASEEKYLKKLEEDIQVAYAQTHEINLIRFQHQYSEEAMKKLKNEMQILKSREKPRLLLLVAPAFISGSVGLVVTSTLLMIVPPLIRTLILKRKFTVNIINNTDKSIEVSFYSFWDKNNWILTPGGKKSYRFKSWDIELRTTAYKFSVTYDDKTAKFWAFGKEAPRSDNTIIIKSDGIYLDGHKHASWE